MYSQKIPLDILEKSYLIDKEPFLITLEIIGNKSIELDTLKRAISKATDKNPIVRSILAGRLGYSHWMDSKTPVPVFDRPTGNEIAAWKDHNVRKDPNVIIIRTQKGMIIQSHHALIDGVGTLMFIEDIFRCLRGEEPIGTNALTTTTDVYFSTTPENNPRVPPATKDASLPFTATNKRMGTMQKRLTIEGRFGQPMGKAAYAIAKAIDGKTRLKLMVDLRHHRPKEERTMRNMTSFILLDIEDQHTHKDIQKNITDKLKANHDLPYTKPSLKILVWFGRWTPIGIFRWLLSSATKKAHLKPEALYSGVLSSFGRLPKNFHFDDFSSETFYALSHDDPSTPFFCCMSYTRDRIELMFRMSSRLGSDGRLEVFVEKVKKYLLEIK